MYGTTREFLDRFGLKDLTDLPKIEDIADVLGFEPPSGLTPGAATVTLPFETSQGTVEAAETALEQDAIEVEETSKTVH
jgi:hypothetical protein